MSENLKSLGHSINSTEKLRKLIQENPDLPLVFIVESDVVADCDYVTWLVPQINCHIGEILDCEQYINDERIYTDRDEFEEDVEDFFFTKYDYDSLTDESEKELEMKIKDEIKKYEPYWKKCIIVEGGV